MAGITKQFKLILVGHYWDLVPEYSIYCDETMICRREMPTKTGVPNIETFTHTDTKILRVQFENKASDQSVLNLNRDRLIRDMLLEVRELEVNGEMIPVSKTSNYVFDQKQMYNGNLVKEAAHITIMGFNGKLLINIP
jgi:histone acetyltransferase (RNA polymerase elongator complex component)